MSLKACTHCSKLTEKERCPVCKNPTSSNWTGFLIIIDPENSTIAKELGIGLAGDYALRVK